jgi:hypothetical protein
LIACIGELFEEPDVVGVALKIKAKEDSLFLWNKDVNLRYKLGYDLIYIEPFLRLILREKLKNILQLPPNCVGMEYSFNRNFIEVKDEAKVQVK